MDVNCTCSKAALAIKKAELQTAALERKERERAEKAKQNAVIEQGAYILRTQFQLLFHFKFIHQIEIQKILNDFVAFLGVYFLDLQCDVNTCTSN